MASTEDLQRVARTMRRDCLAMCVRRLNRRITRIYDAALRPHGVSTAQLNILAALAFAGSARQADIARALGLEKSTVSRNLDRMLQNDWIEVVGVESGGQQQVRLLAPGRKVVERALPAWRTAQRKAGAELHADLVEALMRAARASEPRDPESQP